MTWMYITGLLLSLTANALLIIKTLINDKEIEKIKHRILVNKRAVFYTHKEIELLKEGRNDRSM